MHRCGGDQLRFVANAWRAIISNHAQSLPRCWRAGLPPIPALRRMQRLVPEPSGFEAPSQLTAEVWCAERHTSCGQERMPPGEVQEFLWQQFFADPTQWWENRRSKPSSRHPDFRHKKSKASLWLNNWHKPAWVDSQLATWDSGMKRPPESLSTSVQEQGPGLDVGLCTKLCEDGRITDAVDALNLLVRQGCPVPNNLFYRILKRCKDLVLGRRVHALAVESGYEGDAFLATHLIGLYASHGRLKEATRVFTKVSTPDAYNWATMIFALARHGEAAEAIRLYRQMRESSTVEPTDRVYVAVLKACAAAGDLVAGKEVHAHILGSPEKADIFVQTGLVDMYAKCGSLEDARSVFDSLPVRNIVTWNSMITGYAQQEMGQEALSVYSSMQQEGITSPDSFTFACLLQACASVGVGALDQGKQLHAQIEARGLQADVVLGGSLVNMYAKCGSAEDARCVFDRLPDRDVVTWTGMIAGYAQQGMGQEALSLYSSMQQEGVMSPDSVTFVCLLQACSIVAALPLGKQLHAQIEGQGLQADVVVGAALVNMYAKCGRMVDSQQVFDSLPEGTVEAWNALIGGYTCQGDSEVVFDLLEMMRLEGIQPNGITFLSVLTVCSHAGLVDKGRKYFDAMDTDYGIRPTVEHYTCMMDLLGRAGHLDDALQMAKSMPFTPDGAVWLTLLGACQKWMNVEIGQQAFEGAVSVDGKDASSYVLMSNIYAGAGMWDEAKQMQARRLKSGAWKKPGQSWWTDMGGVVHTFVVGDKKHPESEGSTAVLDGGRSLDRLPDNWSSMECNAMPSRDGSGSPSPLQQYIQQEGLRRHHEILHRIQVQGGDVKDTSLLYRLESHWSYMALVVGFLLPHISLKV